MRGKKCGHTFTYIGKGWGGTINFHPQETVMRCPTFPWMTLEKAPHLQVSTRPKWVPWLPPLPGSNKVPPPNSSSLLEWYQNKPTKTGLRKIQSLRTCKNILVSVKNHSSYQEPGRPQIEWKKKKRWSIDQPPPLTTTKKRFRIIRQRV